MFSHQPWYDLPVGFLELNVQNQDLRTAPPHFIVYLFQGPHRPHHSAVLRLVQGRLDPQPKEGLLKGNHHINHGSTHSRRVLRTTRRADGPRTSK